MTDDPDRAAWLRRPRDYLRRADPVRASLIDDRPAFDPRACMEQLPPMDLYGALLFQATGQQLSVAATRRTCPCCASSQHWTADKARQRRVTAEGVAIAILGLA